MTTRILTLVGAAGGVGTTRLSVEFGATLARAGNKVAIVDAAFTTQGLSSYVPGPIEHDMTALVTEEATLQDVLVELDLDIPGQLTLCPARGPFERQSRAKTAVAAERFERQLAAVSLSHDLVIVDTPPVGSNPAISALNAADRVAIVTRPTERGADALALTKERLGDIGNAADVVIANHADEETKLPDAEVYVPTSESRTPQDAPAVLPPDDTFAPAVCGAVESLLDVSLELEFPESGRLSGVFS